MARGRLLDVSGDESRQARSAISSARVPRTATSRAGRAARRVARILMSPLMVAAAAVTGSVADAREVFGRATAIQLTGGNTFHYHGSRKNHLRSPAAAFTFPATTSTPIASFRRAS